jgi:hypothetical protein
MMRSTRMMMTVAVCAASVLAACSPTEPGDGAELLRNMNRWAAHGHVSYEVVVRRSHCECLPAMVTPIRLVVRDDAVESVVDARNGEPAAMDLFHALTVSQLFELVQEALDDNAYEVRVEYDSALGYPRSIYIDQARDMADDEIFITTEDLTPLAAQ